jgi:hypothetical protein
VPPRACAWAPSGRLLAVRVDEAAREERARDPVADNDALPDTVAVRLGDSVALSVVVASWEPEIDCERLRVCVSDGDWLPVGLGAGLGLPVELWDGVELGCCVDDGVPDPDRVSVLLRLEDCERVCERVAEPVALGP